MPAAQKPPEAYSAKIFVLLVGIFMTMYTFLFSMAGQVTKRISDKSASDPRQGHQEQEINATMKEEFRPPSPIKSLTHEDAFSSVVKRLCELEEKVDTLQSKPSAMPFEKEELLNAAVCRMDALEAELIATKRVSSHALLVRNENNQQMERSVNVHCSCAHCIVRAVF